MIADKLNLARRDLLDLGLRNSLLNYRPLKSRGVEIVDELPGPVYEALVLKQKAMTFLHGREENSNEGYSQPDEPDAASPAERHLDLHLQTELTPRQLQSRLLQTYYAARSFIEEQGINVLYLALGMLKWYESDASEQVRRAPIVLVPVTLDRANANTRFRLTWSGEDVDGNLSLVEKLRSEWHITLPMLSETEDEEDIPGYFDIVREAVKSLNRWEVDDKAIALGFFSFGKLLMYKDLEPATWQGEDAQRATPLLQSLLGDGFNEPPSPFEDDSSLDQHLDPASTRFVMDADGSQSLVVLDAKAGRSLVVQGPPGTGKSQTITNLIGDAIGDGKKILFVAEKMAALEVVKRRLDSIGLGAACLELHSHKTKKRELLDELRATLELGRPVIGSPEQDIEELKRLRERLNDYCLAMNEPIGASEITPFNALGGLLRLRRLHAPAGISEVKCPGMEEWDATGARHRFGLAREMENRLEASGPLVNHTFYGSQLTAIAPTMYEHLQGMITSAAQSLLAAEDAGRQLAESNHCDPPQSQSAHEQLHHGASMLLEAPDLSGVRVAESGWTTHREALTATVDAGRRLKELHFLYDDVLLPEAWEQDLLETRQHVANLGPRWYRFLSGNWRKSKARMRGLCKGQFPRQPDKLLAMIDAILEAQRLTKELNEGEHIASNLFGERWLGAKSDWESLKNVSEFLATLHGDVAAGNLPRGIIEAAAGGVDKSALATRLNESRSKLTDFGQKWSQLADALLLDVARRFPASESPKAIAYSAIGEFLERCETNPADIHSLIAVNQTAKTLREQSLGPLMDLVETPGDHSKHLEDTLRHAWYASLIDCAYRERPALAQFEGVSHTRAIERFCELDKLVLSHTRAILALSHWNGLPRHDAGEGQLGVLRREFEKKSRHMPIRRLMERSGRAIQAIKPVFLMGPMSVASYLSPGSVTFDMVVFDEASQVQPVDAIGALLRGRQAIVVGDSKQLPPTSFFDKVMGGGDDADDDNGEFSPSGDLESILGLFVAQRAPQRMLRWHYRSRHESLIALSNREFYDNRLVIFPSPDHSREELGLVFHHLPEAIYDAGRSRKNIVEARTVADAVMEHARKCPHLTLGVAAFSIPQAEAIRDEVEQRRREQPELEGFFTAHPFEPFFVKNLESVQGDERDVIFISVGYGRDEHGKVSMNFGPLNRDGGERRLNVLITRSKRRCEVFTNLTYDQIDLSRTNARGVNALRQFLHYAQTGTMPKAKSVGGEAMSLFEEEVLHALTQHGYRVDCQVGSAGYFLDLAVEHPERPGKYLLGIECDGASYHSARTARDRDRTRQAVLEGLGWRIHRIWSTDWFRDPAKEMEKVLQAIEQAVLQSRDPSLMPPPLPSAPLREFSREEVDEELPESPTEPYRVASIRLRREIQELLNVLPDKLVEPITDVVTTESPVHVDEVCRRLLDAAGKRSGTRLQATLMAGIAHAVRSGAIIQRGEFLFDPAQAASLVRDRSDAPTSLRKPEMIAPEEWDEAILLGARLTLGIEEERLPNVVSRLLGLTTTASVRTVIEDRISRLLQDDRLRRNGRQLTAT
jgi:very-short-patch-repair endonuclease